MSGNSLDEVIMIMKWIGLIILILAGLSILLYIMNTLLQKMVRRKVWETDLDLIGKQAQVIQTIRPWRPGKVSYREVSDDLVVADAVSEKMIVKGSTVLITAISEGRLRVLPIDSAGKPILPHA